MPSTSKKQHNFMAAIANNPAFSKKVGIPQSVGKDFTAADKGRKFRTGGRPAAINKQNTQHGSMDMPFKSLKRFAGIKSGGKVKKYVEGDEVSNDYESGSSQAAADAASMAAAKPAAAKPKIYTKETLVKAGFAPTDLRGYLNYMKTKTGSMAASQRSADAFEKSRGEKDAYADSLKPSKARLTQEQMASGAEEARKRGMSSSSPKGSYEKFVGKTPQQTAMQDILRNSGRFNKGGNVKAKMEMKKGGMHKMPDGKMMKDSAMKKGGMPMKDGKPAFMMGKKIMGGGMAGYAKGGGIESKGKTKGTVIRMASGGSVSARADGIAQRGKTKFKMC